jgi:hypothetical protein
MKELISAINKLQDVFNTLNLPNSIELPQIVMLGSQVKKNENFATYSLTENSFV